MVSISRLAMACTASADGWVTSPCSTRKMHCRWAVTLRPVDRNRSVNSSGDFTATAYHQQLFFNNDCRYVAGVDGGIPSDLWQSFPHATTRPLRRVERRPVPPG